MDKVRNSDNSNKESRRKVKQHLDQVAVVAEMKSSLKSLLDRSVSDMNLLKPKVSHISYLGKSIFKFWKFHPGVKIFSYFGSARAKHNLSFVYFNFF